MIKFKSTLYALFLVLFFTSGITAQTVTSPEVTAEDIKTHISFLASDELAGRYPGTEGSYLAADYIRNQFRDAGLKLQGNDGFQEFEVVVSVSAGENNTLKFNDRDFAAGIDFTPFPFSKSSTVKAPVVFAGYGFEIVLDSLVWKDYEGIDVTGKWVLILRGDPEMDKQESRFILLLILMVIITKISCALR